MRLYGQPWRVALKSHPALLQLHQVDWVHSCTCACLSLLHQDKLPSQLQPPEFILNWEAGWGGYNSVRDMDPSLQGLKACCSCWCCCTPVGRGHVLDSWQNDNRCCPDPQAPMHAPETSSAMDIPLAAAGPCKRPRRAASICFQTSGVMMRRTDSAQVKVVSSHTCTSVCKITFYYSGPCPVLLTVPTSRHVHSPEA